MEKINRVLAPCCGSTELGTTGRRRRRRGSPLEPGPAMEVVEETRAGVEQGRTLAVDDWSWLVLELAADLGDEAPRLWPRGAGRSRRGWPGKARRRCRCVRRPGARGARCYLLLQMRASSRSSRGSVLLQLLQAKRRRHLQLCRRPSAKISSAPRAGQALM
jgi:hypothetical protein